MLRVPFGNVQEDPRRTAARHGRANAGRRRIGPGGRPQQAGRKPAHLGAALPVERDAAQRQAARCRHQRLREVDLARRARSTDRSHADGGKEPKDNRESRPARSLVLQASTAHRSAKRCAHSRSSHRYRSIHSRTTWKRKAFRHRPKLPARALYRRLYYDLIGLPPTAEELDAFAADPSDAHYEATVDRLLASPRFGERWARHWLDVARYADTKGYVFEEDRNYKQAYTYRDWVIASFNSDRPFDKFIVAQIAADQIDDKTCAPATGFLTLGRRFLNVQPDIINDRIDVVSRGLMGLTVACARCHDHKFDPISAADYYALYGVFASATEKPREDAPPQLVDNDKPYDPVVFLRGDPGSPGPKVDRRFITILSPDDKPVAFQHGSGRREMAEAIASRNNPLTARVWVNRVWGHLFGSGIVDTPSDFGVRGTPPTHPELLDSLACELMDDGWSTKRLIRRLVLSATYRQSSQSRAECVAVDPENKLYWRANRRRLDLESLRDSLIAVGRSSRRENGRPIRLADRRTILNAPLGLRFHRTPKPAGVFPHVRFRKPKHAHPRATANHRPATSAVSDEQPLRHRTSNVPGRAQRYARGGWGRASGEPPDRKRQRSRQPRPPHQPPLPPHPRPRTGARRTNRRTRIHRRRRPGRPGLDLQVNSPGNSAGAPSTSRPAPSNSNPCPTSPKTPGKAAPHCPIQQSAGHSSTQPAATPATPATPPSAAGPRPPPASYTSKASSATRNQTATASAAASSPPAPASSAPGTSSAARPQRIHHRSPSKKATRSTSSPTAEPTSRPTNSTGP